MRGKVSKWGNSLEVRLPRSVAETAGLSDGEAVELTATPGRVAIRRVKPRVRYTLEELVAEAKRLGPGNAPPTLDWGPDRGSEIIEDEYSRGNITMEDLLDGKKPA